MAKKGHVPWNKGLTKDTDSRVLRISVSETGKHVSEETKAKMSARLISEETRAKMSASHTGTHVSEATREAHRRIRGWHHSEETKAKLRITMNSPAVIEKIASKLRGQLNPSFGIPQSEEAKVKVRKAKALWFENPDNRRITLEAGYKGWLTLTHQLQKYLKEGLPNPSERNLLDILQALYPGDFRYNDGWFVLGGKLPDFVNINGKKKLIELFGEAYHKEADVKFRTYLFASFGWDTLVIWARELKNKEAVVTRIRQFMEVKHA